MVAVSSWGRLNSFNHQVTALTSSQKVASQIKQNSPGLAYGNGRSYGDVCLNPAGNLWKTTHLDHFIRFDEKTGRLSCEAGVLLRDIQRITIPMGWILPVTPGTQLITIGGAIANDIHGKNHHVAGNFGHHVRKFKLARTSGEILECSQTANADWFAATVGGLGLTGVIVEVEMQLRPVTGAWLEVETIPYESLEEFFELANASESDWEHTVSWVDCMSGGATRGIFMRGNFTAAHQGAVPNSRALMMPIVPPFSLVNHLTLKPFNAAYFYKNRWQAGKSFAQYQSFFYPLDHLQEWNRMYGPKGFYQYQCVVPRATEQATIKAILDEIAKSGEGSFLAVLKTFGNVESLGMLSFPMPGVTLALDFPNKGESTLSLFNRLDSIVAEAKGRLYMAKDARMPKTLFEAGYPKLNTFVQYRDHGISSAMSRRLMGS